MTNYVCMHVHIKKQKEHRREWVKEKFSANPLTNSSSMNNALKYNVKISNVYGASHGHILLKYIIKRRLSLNRFLAKTLGVNKIAVNSFSKIWC